MSLKIRCTRATDGNELFLLSFWHDGRAPDVYVLNREGTEDLIYQITSAVRAYDAAQNKKPTPPDGDPLNFKGPGRGLDPLIA